MYPAQGSSKLYVCILHVFVHSICMKVSALLLHQLDEPLLSRGGRIADCAVRHPGVKRSLSRYYLLSYL